jgi:hypothetical protein
LRVLRIDRHVHGAYPPSHDVLDCPNGPLKLEVEQSRVT